VKVLPKKRAHDFRRNLSLKIPLASIINHRVIWYSASLLLYGWFLSWIAYDIFVWHKPINQVSLTNYVGAVTAMALIWAGTKLFKAPSHVVVKQPRRQKNFKDKEPSKRNRQPPKPTSPTPPQPQQPTPAQPEPQPQPEQPKMPMQPKQTAPTIPGCTRHLGYLHQPGKTREIPDECLTCKELIQCLSATG